MPKQTKSYHSVEELYKQAGANQPCYKQAGGFLVEEENDVWPVRRIRSPNFETPPEPTEGTVCKKCGTAITTSFLYSSFGHLVCDSCGKDDEHKLITRTEAKSRFLLVDCDLDLRQPPLRYLNRKNPRNPRYGDMKLYLQSQVEERAISIWGSLDAIEQERAKRKKMRNLHRNQRYNKRLSELRKQVRGDLYNKAKDSHVHSFGEECFDSATDKYFKSCTECQFKVEYEKM